MRHGLSMVIKVMRHIVSSGAVGGRTKQSQNKLNSRSVRGRLGENLIVLLNVQTRKNCMKILNLLPDGRADGGRHLSEL